MSGLGLGLELGFAQEEMASTSAKPFSMEKIPKNKEELGTTTFSLFHFQWYDFGSHLSLVQPSLKSQLKQLNVDDPPPLEEQHQAKSPPPPPEEQQQAKPPSPPPPPQKKKRETQQSLDLRMLCSTNLKLLCSTMNVIGLRHFIMDNQNVRFKGQKVINRKIVIAAMKYSPNPSKLVLDTLQGFYPMKKGTLVCASWKICLWLLLGVSKARRGVRRARTFYRKTKNQAKKLAVDWKGEVNPELYLRLLTTYQLTDGNDANELVDMLVMVASSSKRDAAVHLCKGLGLDKKVPDIIKKLNNKKRQLDAIKFVCAFKLVDIFPLVPLLEAFLKESNKTVQESLDKGNNSLPSQKAAIEREIFYLESMTKCIKAFKLHSQFPTASLYKRIDEQKKQQKLLKKHPDAVDDTSPRSEIRLPNSDCPEPNTSNRASTSLNDMQYTGNELEPLLA